MKTKLTLLLLAFLALPLAFVDATGLTIDSTIQDMDYDDAVSVGDYWLHEYSNGNESLGVIKQLNIDPVFTAGYDWNSDGKVQIAEFQAWARWATGDTWNMTLANPSITSVVYDLDNDGLVSLGDTFRHHYNSTGFVLRGDILQVHLDGVLNNGYDANSDGDVQVGEFQAMANGLTDDTWTITLQATTVRYVRCYIYDQDSDYYVSDGDYYYDRYYATMWWTGLSETRRGLITQDEIDNIIAQGYDSNSDDNISTTEYDAYKTGTSVHYWYVYRQNAQATVNSDYYSFIYDADDDGTDEVELGDPYLHQKANGEVHAEGTIVQGDLNAVLTAHDLNSDGKVQVNELEAAAEYYSGDSWYIQMAPATIDTTDYWPIETGNYWEFHRYGYTSYRTRVEIEEDQYGSQFAYFTKNHIDTYWGIGGDPDGALGGNHPGSPVELGIFLKWYVAWDDDDWLVASNSRGDYSGSYDGKPEDVRYRGSDGKLFRMFWYVEDPGEDYAPYCLWPETLDIYGTNVDSYQYHPYMWYDGTHVSLSAGWGVDYKWAYVKTDVGYEGPALRVQFFEPLSSGFSTVEDWYLVEGYGVVKIEQYTHTDRAEEHLNVRILIDKLVVKE